MARIGSIIAPLINSLGDKNGYERLPFLIFGIAGVFGAIVALILPETLNKRLPENINESIEFNSSGMK
jgi:MFS transporter, OCT family, solute carrier family 22 (organic cation transporter), member 4/5